jgi:hypothetical protein
MIKHNIRVFGFAIIGLAFFVYVLIFLITQDLESIDFQKALSHISTTISINIFIWMIFISWAWKWKIFYSWLVQTPDLSGKWKGKIKSNWNDGKEKTIPTEIIIKQDFFNISVRIKTGESVSHSISSSFNIDKDSGLQQLFYSYLNTPKAGIRERSAIHYGSTLLNFDGYKVSKMTGEYWTSRETTGEIELKREKQKKKK